jgi:hypothetical protein
MAPNQICLSIATNQSIWRSFKFVRFVPFDLYRFVNAVLLIKASVLCSSRTLFVRYFHTWGIWMQCIELALFIIICDLFSPTCSPFNSSMLFSLPSLSLALSLSLFLSACFTCLSGHMWWLVGHLTKHTLDFIGSFSPSHFKFQFHSVEGEESTITSGSAFFRASFPISIVIAHCAHFPINPLLVRHFTSLTKPFLPAPALLSAFHLLDRL